MAQIYKCQACGAYFDEPYTVRICLEDEYGVGSLFHDRHYVDVECCPYCDSSGFELTDDEEDWI